MTIRELIKQLSEVPAELPVYVASTLGDDQCELELVLPHLGRERRPRCRPARTKKKNSRPADST